MGVPPLRAERLTSQGPGRERPRGTLCRDVCNSAQGPGLLTSHPSRPQGCPAPERAEGKAWSGWAAAAGSHAVTHMQMGPAPASPDCSRSCQLMPPPAQAAFRDGRAALSSPRCPARGSPTEPLGRIPDSGEGVLVGGGMRGPLGHDRARLGQRRY